MSILNRGGTSNLAFSLPSNVEAQYYIWIPHLGVNAGCKEAVHGARTTPAYNCQPITSFYRPDPSGAFFSRDTARLAPAAVKRVFRRPYFFDPLSGQPARIGLNGRRRD